MADEKETPDLDALVLKYRQDKTSIRSPAEMKRIKRSIKAKLRRRMQREAGLRIYRP
jgi:hypothetical protein